MNIFGKLPESSALPGKLDYAGALKVLRLACVAAGAAGVGYLVQALTGFDLVKESKVDEQLITLFLIPALEAVRRTLADYSAS